MKKMILLERLNSLRHWVKNGNPEVRDAEQFNDLVRQLRIIYQAERDQDFSNEPT